MHLESSPTECLGIPLDSYVTKTDAARLGICAGKTARGGTCLVDLVSSHLDSSQRPNAAKTPSSLANPDLR